MAWADGAGTIAMISVSKEGNDVKHVLQSLATGKTLVADVPEAAAYGSRLLIQTSVSLLSSGTERMLVDFGRAGWIRKVRQQPDKVREVIQKMHSDGIWAALEAVKAKLDVPLSLGYSAVGIVRDVGPGVRGFRVGQRVVSNGAHAEVVAVPQNLCARVPEQVPDEQAAFTIVAAIALEGVRLANPTMGECFVVTGLGLIGLLAVQLLRAHGCRVLAVELDESRLALARAYGAAAINGRDANAVLVAAETLSRGRGVDGVLLTLASNSNKPMRQAAQMCRKRGRIVLVGTTGLELNRSDFYSKELSFQVSCSYGPGRYDTDYEEKGHDYPIGYVRWTEQRNFEAVLDMMASGRLNVGPLISHRFPIERAVEAYDLLLSGKPSLGIILEYPKYTNSGDISHTIKLPQGDSPPPVALPVLSFIGAGNYGSRVLLPAFKSAGVCLNTVITTTGVSGAHYGLKFGFRQASTDTASIFQGNDDAVVIATRHDTHACLVVQALNSGKHVFVEKPLALTEGELDRIQDALIRRPDRILMVGFNRRFAPHVRRMKSLLDSIEGPKAFIMTVNAGTIPRGHWTQDPEVGGGRIVGEACHFIDLMRHLAGRPIKEFGIVTLADSVDTATISLSFEDGSLGTIHYLANGHKTVPKERFEVFCSGRVLQLDNFRKLRAFGWPGLHKMVLRRQDKGQRGCVQAFVRAIKDGGAPPIPREELLEVARIGIKLQP